MRRPARGPTPAVPFVPGEAPLARLIRVRVRRSPTPGTPGETGPASLGPALPTLPGLREAVRFLRRHYWWRSRDWQDERVQDLLAWLSRPESALTLARSVLRGIERAKRAATAKRPTVADLLAWRLCMQVRTLVDDAEEREARRRIAGGARVPLEGIATQQWDPAAPDLDEERLRLRWSAEARTDPDAGRNAPSRGGSGHGA